MSELERRAAVDAVAADPAAGDMIEGSGGCRKLRIARRGQGKSGGYRVVSAYVGPARPVYLLAVLAKGSRANFSQSEIAAMRAAMTALKSACRPARR